MSVAVCLPWYDSGSDERRAVFETVRGYWEASDWPLHVSRFARERAAARNEAALAAISAGAEVLILNDADTLCLGGAVEQAAALAAEAPGLVYCFDLYLRLTREATERMLELGPGAQWPLAFERQYFNAPSIGCVALSTQTFLQTGGLDERYQGWGYEDLAFVDACQRVAPLRRVPGPAFHLWHGERYGDEPEALSYGATMISAPLDADPVRAEQNRRRWRLDREEEPSHALR
jgi:hypothetical protein